MCGFAGFLAPRAWPAAPDIMLKAMTDVLAHRGPDDSGYWLDAESGVALGHRRLSIIDLSTAGHQPMVSASGRYVVAYNGEIYNHHDIRRSLEEAGAELAWRGHSDTEVLLAAIEHRGVEGALEEFNGMFAFALWDRQARALYLARDRLGEKPLYYGFAADGAFLFGSELKALAAWPGLRREVDREALTLFLRHNYVPAPWSIWHGIRKLPPAHFLCLRAGDHELPSPQCYWDLTQVALAGVRNPLRDEPELVDRLEALLMDAVALRMEADVPLGAFLSGGIDSSTIVALMQAQSSKPVRTFSIGFHEKAYNEAEHAAAVARHLGTDHTELYVTPEDARNVIPKIPEIWDEPFSDSSQIPTFLVSEMTRRHVTVSLSGDAGDELFGGYNRYFRTQKIWCTLARLPQLLRWAGAVTARSRPAILAGRVADHVLGWAGISVHAADRLPKLARLLGHRRPTELYLDMISHWKDPTAIVVGGIEPTTVLTAGQPDFPDFRHVMMYLDTLTYLPDDILAKVDRASMAVSLEARVPFLDHRVVEFAWKLPMSSKIRGGTGKRILREVLYRHVPRTLIDRPKMGFGVPIDDWLRGPLRDWAESLLDEGRLREEGFFDPAPIRKLWEEHQTGRRRWHYYLWDILMFQSWWERQKRIE